MYVCMYVHVYVYLRDLKPMSLNPRASCKNQARLGKHQATFENISQSRLRFVVHRSMFAQAGFHAFAADSAVLFSCNLTLPAWPSHDLEPQQQAYRNLQNFCPGRSPKPGWAGWAGFAEVPVLSSLGGLFIPTCPAAHTHCCLHTPGPRHA